MEEVTEVVEEVVVDEEKSPTQYRVERAERQTEERILKELGATSLDDLKAKLEQATVSERVLQETQKELETASRKERLASMLKDEKAFDPVVLLPFVDVDQLKSDEDFDKAVKELMKLKPNHFGVTTVESDNFIESKEIESNPIRTAELRGDFQGSIAEFLRQSKKNGG